MSPPSSGWVSVTTHSCLRALGHQVGLGEEGRTAVTDKDKGVFTFFFTTLWLICLILDSVPGPPQHPGTRHMGVVRWDRHGLWGQMDLCSNPAVIYPCMTLNQMTELLNHSITSSATQASLEGAGDSGLYALGIVNEEFLI